MKVSAARRLIFLLKPLLTIINNKQVEYISSAGSSSQAPVRLDGVTLGVVVGGGAAVFRGEGSRDGDGVLWWHPLSRNPITSGNCSCHEQLPFVTLYKTRGAAQESVYHSSSQSHLHIHVKNPCGSSERRSFVGSSQQ